MLSRDPEHNGLHLYLWCRPTTNPWLNKCANVLWFLGPCSKPVWLKSGVQVPHVSYQRRSIWFKLKSCWDVDGLLARTKQSAKWQIDTYKLQCCISIYAVTIRLLLVTSLIMLPPFSTLVCEPKGNTKKTQHHRPLYTGLCKRPSVSHTLSHTVIQTQQISSCYKCCWLPFHARANCRTMRSILFRLFLDFRHLVEIKPAVSSHSLTLSHLSTWGLLA